MTSNTTPNVQAILDAPIPIFISLYALSLLTSMSGMEIFGWATCAFTLLYILANHFMRMREFYFFRLGVELPLLGLIFIVWLGLTINAPDAEKLDPMGSLRWILMLYLFTYTLELFPSLNKIMYIFLFGGTLVGAYGIFQHFTCLDLVRGAERPLTFAPVEGATTCQSIGFMSHHLTYGYSAGMFICFAFAGFLLGKRKSTWHRIGFFISTVVIALSLLWTYGRGVWIAVILAFFVMTSYVSKKHFFSFILIAAIIFGVVYTSNPELKERFNSIWSDQNFSNVERQGLWKANFEMFKDHPWLGVGYGQNLPRLQEYYQKVNVTREWGGHAHNNYLQMLSTTGILGFFCYMLFILTFLLMTHRLWLEVPETHFWHRVIILGALGAQICLHTGGITQWNFGDAEVNHLFIFILAMVAFLAEKYARGIVPDDYAL